MVFGIQLLFGDDKTTTHMTKELALKLIEWYKESIRLIIISKSIYDMTDILLGRDVHSGVCHCANMRFGKNIFSDPWVADRTKGYYWHQTPFECETREEIINSLQYRVNILETFWKHFDIKKLDHEHTHSQSDNAG